MLTMAASQMSVLQDAEYKKVAADILKRTEAYWPESFSESLRPESTARVQRALMEARRYGFVSEFDLSRFVQLCFLLQDSDFHGSEWAQEHLEAIDVIGPRATMNKLVETARALSSDPGWPRD